MIRSLDLYACDSDNCLSVGLGLLRTCAHHGIVLRVWPGTWLRPVGADVPAELADLVLAHRARLAVADWDGSMPALLLPDGRAGGGTLWLEFERELDRPDAGETNRQDAKAVKAPVKP
jgi:hypothetical protein